MTEEQQQDQICLFHQGDYRNKDYNPEKLSWVRILVKIFSVPWKLMTVEEHR
jgi:hypothetical protein